MKTFLKKVAHPLIKLSWLILPLQLRQRMAVRIGETSWLPGHSWLAMAMIRDLADVDANSYNRFLWSSHIGYATNYEYANDFGPEHLTATRKMLFEHIVEYLRDNGITPEVQIRSLFEVGCASGFLLRHMETCIFPQATVIEGVDIDATAIETGMAYLTQHDSRIRISCADMADLDSILGENRYDLILCAGCRHSFFD